MRRTCLAILFVATLGGLLCAPVQSAIIAGPVVNPANGASYYLISPGTWTSSEAAAEAMGGNLATVNSDAENTWIVNTFDAYGGGGTAGPNMWIGLHDPDIGDGPGSQHVADFIWSSGSAATYRNWAVNEPNDDLGWGGEYYTALFFSTHNAVNPYQWNDQNNSGSGTSDYGLVEIAAIPEPTTSSLLAMIGAMLLRRRRTKR